MAKVKAVTATTTKAAHKRSEHAKNERGLRSAAAKRIADLERELRIAKAAFNLAPPPSPEERAVLDAVESYFTPSRLVIVLQAGMQPGIEGLAQAVVEWRKARE